MFAFNAQGAHTYSILVCAPFRAAAAAIATAPPPPATPATPREAPRDAASATAHANNAEEEHADDIDNAMMMRSSAAPTTSPFDALPSDVLRRILAPLAAALRDLLAARAVCVTWRDVADGEPALWRVLRLSDDAHLAAKLTDGALEALARRAAGGLRELDVSGCAQVTPAALAALASAQPWLDVLRAATRDGGGAADGLTDEAQWWSLEQARARARCARCARSAIRAQWKMLPRARTRTKRIARKKALLTLIRPSRSAGARGAFVVPLPARV
jgi:hypothetical protein